MMTNRINEMAAGIWPASLTLAGQAAVLVVVLLLAEWAFRRRLPAAWAAALWLLVLVRLVLPPGLQSPTSVSFWLGPWLAAPIRVTASTPVALLARVEQKSVAPPKLAAPASVTPSVIPAPRLSRSGWLLVGWGVGSLIWLCWMVRKNQEVQRLVRSSMEASVEGNAALRRAAAEVGLRRLPRLRLTSQDHSPAVWGWFQPVVLLPKALAESLSPAGLRDVLAHELIHLRRGDLWLNLPQVFLQALWWWNPVVWLANARIRMWREQAVDDAVMALSPEEEASYPQTLLEVARFCAARPTLSLGFVGILESRGSLRRRVLRLVNAPPARRTRLGWAGWLVVLLVAVLALPMAFARRVEVGTAVGSVSQGKDASLQPLEIQVSSDGFEVGGQQMGPEEFARQLSKEKSINPERTVSLTADSEDEWKYVIKALDLVKRAGITNVKAFTRRRQAVRYEGFSPEVTAVLEARAAEPGAVKIRSPQIESARTLAGSSASESSEWRPWSPEAVENALAVGRPVLVLVTAKWDVSGLAYRRGLLESPEVRDRLHDLEALQLEADWTNPNAAIEALLKRFNRSGVPLVLWYRPGAEPVALDDGGGVASILAALAPTEESQVPRALIEVETKGAEVRYRFQNEDVLPDELKRRLMELGKTAPDTTLRIRLYGGSRPEQVSDVLEWSKIAGLSRVDLATSALPLARVTPPHVSKAPLRIEVGALPSLYQIGGERMTRDQLVRRLEQERTDNPQRSIVVVGSSEAGWKELVGIHELCRKVGFSNVSLDRSGPDRESRLALLHEFGLTWTELEVWARDNVISLEASAATLRGHLLKNPPRRLETLKEWDSSPPRWVTVKMIETSVEGLELPLRDIQVESSGGARVASAGDPTLPWPSTVEGGLHFSGAVSMNGLIELERWKAIQKDIESRPGTRTPVTSTSHLVGRQDWGLSPVDVSANDFQRPGVPSDLLALQSTVRSNGVAFKATVRPNNWSALNPQLPENPLQEFRRELFLGGDQAWVVAILPEPPAAKGSPAGRKVARPAKLIVLTTDAQGP